MGKHVRDIMKRPIKLAGSTSVIEAARRMRDANVGTVIVMENDACSGILTDRDIAIRAVAQGRDPNTTRLSEIASKELTTLSPDDDLEHAIELMRKKAIRRMPVVDSTNQTVGIVSLGDLAMDRDPRSVLGQISAAPPNQ